jgi:hypothetical protein
MHSMGTGRPDMEAGLGLGGLGVREGQEWTREKKEEDHYRAGVQLTRFGSVLEILLGIPPFIRVPDEPSAMQSGKVTRRPGVRNRATSEAGTEKGAWSVYERGYGTIRE